MKGLFIVFHGFSAHSGISKKIFAQCEALRRSGAKIALCHLEIGPDGTQRRLAGDEVIRTFGSGFCAKVLKRVSYADITDYIRREGVGFLYIRHDLNANPLLVAWLRRVHRLGVRIALEIPTYPYDAEFRETGLKEQCQLQVDRLFRRSLAREVDRIVTFSDDEEIFGQKTIRISNGIDFDAVPLKTELHDITREVRLLALANIHPWHGFDRVIEGLKDYYAGPHDRVVRLRIVGDGMPGLIGGYARSIEAYGPASMSKSRAPARARRSTPSSRGATWAWRASPATATASRASKASKTANTPRGASRSSTPSGTATSTACPTF